MNLKRTFLRVIKKWANKKIRKNHPGNVLYLNFLFHYLLQSNKNIHQQTSIYFVMLESSANAYQLNIE